MASDDFTQAGQDILDQLQAAGVYSPNDSPKTFADAPVSGGLAPDTSTNNLLPPPNPIDFSGNAGAAYPTGGPNAPQAPSGGTNTMPVPGAYPNDYGVTNDPWGSLMAAIKAPPYGDSRVSTGPGIGGMHMDEGLGGGAMPTWRDPGLVPGLGYVPDSAGMGLAGAGVALSGLDAPGIGPVPAPRPAGPTTQPSSGFDTGQPTSPFPSAAPPIMPGTTRLYRNESDPIQTAINRENMNAGAFGRAPDLTQSPVVDRAEFPTQYAGRWAMDQPRGLDMYARHGGQSSFVDVPTPGIGGMQVPGITIRSGAGNEYILPPEYLNRLQLTSSGAIQAQQALAQMQKQTVWERIQQILASQNIRAVTDPFYGR